MDYLTIVILLNITCTYLSDCVILGMTETKVIMIEKIIYTGAGKGKYSSVWIVVVV
jgi:hypothetical protein